MTLRLAIFAMIEDAVPAGLVVLEVREYYWLSDVVGDVRVAWYFVMVDV